VNIAKAGSVVDTIGLGLGLIVVVELGIVSEVLSFISL